MFWLGYSYLIIYWGWQKCKWPWIEDVAKSNLLEEVIVVSDHDTSLTSSPAALHKLQSKSFFLSYKPFYYIVFLLIYIAV